MEKHFCCLECSNHFLGYDTQTIWFQQAFLLPVGVGICNKCMMYGYGPYNARRSWDPKWIDERLLETWYGCKEGEDGYLTGRPSEKTVWPASGDTKWISFVYLRAWMNTLKAKVDAGLITHGIKIPCAWYSTSQKGRVAGFIWCMKGDEIEVYRDSTKEEKEKYGKTKELIRKRLKVNEIFPPETANYVVDRRKYPKCYSCDNCEIAHTEIEESKVWKGRYFCHTCLKKDSIESRPPAYAGDIHHIGFVETTECGCWSCSSSDLNDNIKHRCGQCYKFSNSGWIDRKTGDSTWFCRECWFSYFEHYKLVMLKDVDPSIKDESDGVHYYNGIWVPKDDSGISKEQIRIVKRYHEETL